MDSLEVSLKPLSDKKVRIVIGQDEYFVSAHFSVRDSKKYCDELEKEQDYNRAIASIILDKIIQDYGEDSPVLQDVIDADDEGFVEYALALVSNSEELREFFEGTDSNLPIRQRFGLAYESYINRSFKQLTNLMPPTLESPNLLIKGIDYSWVNRIQENLNVIRSTWFDEIDRITQTAQIALNAIQWFQQITASISEVLATLNFFSIPETERDEMKENCKKWGELG